MTKIKNTKKGMAKKTLSMSLVVAMLATSNVPVWAAEFSDGTDAAVTSEAEAPVIDEFSDTEEETPAVVDDAEVTADVAAATTTEKALYLDKAEVGKPVSFGTDSTLKNSEGKVVSVFDYEWLIDGVQPANSDGTAMNGCTGQVRLGGRNATSADVIAAITATGSFTPQANQLGGKLTLKITGVKGTAENFEGFTYETPAVTITAKDITNSGITITQKNALTYDGTAKTLAASDVELDYQSSGYTATDFTASDFKFTYAGDTVNATGNKPVKVTATINKPGYQGSVQFEMAIGQRTLAKANSDPKTLTNKDENDLSVTLKNTQYKYTGENINFTTNVEDNFTLKSNISGNTLSSKAITAVEGKDLNHLKNVGDSDILKVTINKSTANGLGDKELDRNYATGAFNTARYYTADKATVVARDLSTCTIDDISIGSLTAGKITKDDIKALIKISEGKETLSGSATFMNNVDIEVDVQAVNKAKDGETFPVVVKPKDTTKNVIGKKTINLYVAQNDISEATLKTKGAQLNNNTISSSTGTVLDENTVFAAECYQGGANIEKTADQLGTIIISGTNVVLKEGKDYKIVYENNTNIGTAKIYIQGISSTLSGKKCIGKFAIEAATIARDSITVPESVAYDGSKTEASEYLKKSDIKVQAKTYTWSKKTVGNTVSFEKVNKLIDVPENLYDTDFAIDGGGTTIKDGTELTTTVKIADKVDTTSDAYKNYNIANVGAGIQASKNTTVATLSVANADVTVVGAPFVYTGKEITPDLVVKDGDRTLVKDVDYEIASKVNNKNAGTAKITIKGKGDYSDKKTKTVEFTINKADLSKVTITPNKNAANNFKYTGKKLTPAIGNYDIKLGDVVLNPTNENLKVVYPASSSANVNAGKEAGSATLVVKDTAKNPNFEGTNAFKFDIAQKDLTEGGTFTLWKDGKVVTSTQANTTAANVTDTLFTNDGTAHTFDKVTYTPATGTKYKEGVDYEIKYYNNTRGELAAIYVNALGNYKNADANKFADNKTTYTDAKFFKIGSITIKKSDVTVANTEYAGGISVKPTVKVKVNGNTLVEDADYKIETVGDAANVTAKDKILKAKLYEKDGYKLDPTTWGSAYHAAAGSEKAYVELTWKVVAKDLKNTAVSVDEDGNVTVMNGTVVVPSSEYDAKFSEDGKKLTVTAKADSKNYTGSKEVDVESAKVGQAMISDVVVKGNTVTPVLSSEVDGAVGYDYVIATEEDYKNGRVGVSKNILATNTDFHYVQKGTYYAYCHAWKRGADGKKVFGEWSNIYEFTVKATTPSKPSIKSVKVKGHTVTVTFTASKNAKGYDVVLGEAVKKVNGENRPVEYGKLVVKNIEDGVYTATFHNVPDGKYYAGVHSYNRTSEDGKKVFSKWGYKKEAISVGKAK